jgi:hypothetical protein
MLADGFKQEQAQHYHQRRKQIPVVRNKFQGHDLSQDTVTA